MLLKPLSGTNMNIARSSRPLRFTSGAAVTTAISLAGCAGTGVAIGLAGVGAVGLSVWGGSRYYRHLCDPDRIPKLVDDGNWGAINRALRFAWGRERTAAIQRKLFEPALKERLPLNVLAAVAKAQGDDEISLCARRMVLENVMATSTDPLEIILAAAVFCTLGKDIDASLDAIHAIEETRGGPMPHFVAASVRISPIQDRVISGKSKVSE